METARRPTSKFPKQSANGPRAPSGCASVIPTWAAFACACRAHTLAPFRGVDRRFQIRGVERGVTVVDDYGHHPTEIRATLESARLGGYRRILVLFQWFYNYLTRNRSARLITGDEAVRGRP